MLKKYGDISLIDITVSQPEEWNFEGADCARIEIPSNSNFEVQMQDKGFYWADRTLKVSISLAKLPAIPVSEIIKLGENEYGIDNMLEEFEAIEKEGFIKLNKGSICIF